MTINNTIIYLVVIIAITTLLRLLFLDTIPSGFSCDEAANGYEAYSILETMRDRYGKFMPLFLKILGNDYRESLYIFIIVPFIKIFGLNEFGTRFPAAQCGILTVISVYYFVKESFNKRIGLISALLLAINPWHIQFSCISGSQKCLTQPCWCTTVCNFILLWCYSINICIQIQEQRNFQVYGFFDISNLPSY